MFLLCFHLWQIQMSIWRKYVKAWLKDLALNMWSMWVFTLDLDSSKNNTMAATTTQGREFIISRCLSLHLWFLLPQGYKLLIFNLTANRLHPIPVRLRPTSHPWLSLAQISFFSSLSQFQLYISTRWRSWLCTISDGFTWVKNFNHGQGETSFTWTFVSVTLLKLCHLTLGQINP